MSLVTSEPSGEPVGGPPEPARTPPNVRLVAIAVATAIVVLGVLAFFTMRSESGDTDENDGWAGTLLGQPTDKPEFTLTDTSGNAYDFGRQTEGYVTLLYFGYTNCPDVCPLHMANLAAVLQQVSGEVNAKIKVVFVTTDPQRDTPQVIRKWLDNFDVTFVGLTGTPTQITAAEQAAHVPESVLDPPSADGSYAVGHTSQVIAYSLDDEAHVVYPFGIRQADWARDLPRLVRDDGMAIVKSQTKRKAIVVGVAAGLSFAVFTRLPASAGDPKLSVVDAYASESISDSSAVYVTIDNDGGADHLVGATTEAAGSVVLHGPDMTSGGDIRVRGRGTTSLDPGGSHVMLENLSTPLRPGDRIEIELVFDKSAPIDLTVPVVSYDDVLAKAGL